MELRKITLRQRREIIVEGVARIQELYAAGYLDKDGRFRLTACVGRWYGASTSRDVIRDRSKNAA
jgi:hypothetical protein